MLTIADEERLGSDKFLYDGVPNMCEKKSIQANFTTDVRSKLADMICELRDIYDNIYLKNK